MLAMQAVVSQETNRASDEAFEAYCRRIEGERLAGIAGASGAEGIGMLLCYVPGQMRVGACHASESMGINL